MRIGILVPQPVPYELGGAERAYAGLLAALNDLHAHTAEIVGRPVPERTLAEVIAAYEDVAGIDVSGFDAIIACKYPAWMAAHPRLVIYMFHPLRGLYDTYHYAGLPEAPVDDGDPDVRRLAALASRDPERALLTDIFGTFADLHRRRGDDPVLFAHPGPLGRMLVPALDRVGFLGAISPFFALSHTVASRHGYFPPGSHVHPLLLPPDIHGDPEGPRLRFFTASRIDHPKRIDLLITAMRRVREPVTLAVAGTGPDMDRCRALAADDSRITFLGRIDDAALVEQYSQASAVPFIPADEDLGLITLEAMASARAVLTCSDSGGPTELVRNGVNGLVVDPTPEAVAGGLSQLARDPGACAAMGLRAKETVAPITWSRIAHALVEAIPRDPHPPHRSGRPRIVVASTFAVHPARHGGQVRCAGLYGALTSRFDVEIVSLTGPDDPPRCVEIRPGLHETVIQRTPTHVAAEYAVELEAGLPLTDILASELAHLTPRYGEALSRALDGATAAILAHPYLGPIVADLAPRLPVVYDAHNDELRLKAKILEGKPLERELVERVRAIEGAAARRAVLISACSADDAQALRQDYDLDRRRIVVIPNGVDASGVRFTPMAERQRARMVWLDRLGEGWVGSRPAGSALFMGSWHPPNLAAASRLIELAPAVPDIAIVMCGSVHGAFDRTALPRNVISLGVLSDQAKRAVLRAVDMGLNPMGAGSGTNLKVVEYFAAGLPVLSTAIGLRGLDVRPYEHAWMSSTAGWAHGMRTVLANSDRNTTMTRAAREMVETSLDWEVLGKRFADEISLVVESA